MDELLNHLKPSGQTLIEVLVALSAVVIVLSAITFIVMQSINQADRSSDLTTATQHAQEGMELAQARGGFQSGQYFCVGSNDSFGSSRSQPCTSPNVDQYIREVSVVSSSQCSPLLRVTVTVSWNDANCQGSSYCHKVPLTTCL